MRNVGFYSAINVAVKNIARWNDSTMEESMILWKLHHPNIQMFLGLGW